jgi:hypothetical protein
MDELKAIFFVKDYTGDKARKDNYSDEIAGAGRKIEVKFSDGEIMLGYCQGYSSMRQGFFIVPADKNSNNDRIYIVNSATEEVKFC